MFIEPLNNGYFFSRFAYTVQTDPLGGLGAQNTMKHRVSPQTNACHEVCQLIAKLFLLTL